MAVNSNRLRGLTEITYDVRSKSGAIDAFLLPKWSRRAIWPRYMSLRYSTRRLRGRDIGR